MKTFNELGLSPQALSAVARLGYETPTLVQEQAIPLVLAGFDVIAGAKTGTGKTAAFALPALDLLKPTNEAGAPVMLVVTPTRELANQIAEVCLTAGKSQKLSVLCLVGGVSQDPQVAKLKRGVDILIATPGRLLDLMNQQEVNLSQVQLFVVDEADRMLDMGFLPSVKTIAAALPKQHQTLLYSATIDDAVRKQVGSLLHDPKTVEVASAGQTADNVEQFVVHCPKELRVDLLRALLKERGSERVIIFVRTRRRADSLCRRLKKMGYRVEALHSDRSQNQRDRALRNFAEGTTDILVATDVLARGIDVDSVSYVVNFDLPSVPANYVHRIGRTGRADQSGAAISFVIEETRQDLAAIEKFIHRSIPELKVSSFNEEESRAEAVARANSRAAKHDPDIAQAVQELKKRKKRANRAKESTSGKAETVLGSASSKQARTEAASGSPSGRKTKASSRSPHQGAKTTPSRKPKKATAAASAKKDCRPGRAHRATLKQGRRGKSSR